MATENPPSYHEVTARLKELTPDQRETFAAAVTEHLQKPETHKDIVSEVVDLANGASQVDKLFFNVSVDLGKLTYTDENLKVKWDGYYEVCAAGPAGNIPSLLSVSSSQSATKAIVYLDEFTGIILPVLKSVKSADDEQGRRDALAVLKDFLDKVQKGKSIDLKKLEDLGHQYSDQFQKLKNDVGNFIGDFTLYAAARGATLTKEIETAKENLSKLHKELTAINDEVVKWGLALGLTGFGTAVGALIGAAFLGPLGLLGALLVGVIAMGIEAGNLADAVQRAGTKRAQVDLAQLELDKLVAEQKDIALVKARLESKNSDILTIAQKIDQVGLVWVSLALDAERLRSELELFAGSGTGPYILYQTHIKQTEDLYKPLRAGLEAYVKHKGIPDSNE
ncbi:hypothetical protein FRC12_022637 [Ceratobasidium sp. 428]|nr:hypothetical protein FRC12_022637 [Ceratobasidium sp. 428]